MTMDFHDRTGWSLGALLHDGWAQVLSILSGLLSHGTTDASIDWEDGERF